ncbi:tetratricopeptide repeat protein [Kordia sp.]|uniref:tetratricopeptide repeat protein n=1 Tax=Kordia sp. TaxID=1965332 RepID=UPI003B5907E9
MQIRILFTFIIVAIFIGCNTVSNKPSETQSEYAEAYYNQAFSILSNTTHNGLSNALTLEGLEYINKAIAINANQSKYYRVKGSFYSHRRDYEKALKNFKKALQLDPQNSLAYMGQGIVYENTARFDLAKKKYLKALEDPELKVTVNFNLGLLHGKWGKPEKALEYYNKVILFSPNYKSGYLNRGKVKMGLQQYEEALKDFNIALSLKPRDKVSLNNRGLTLFYLHRFEEAIADFEKTLSIGSNASFDENFDTNQYAYNNMANAYFGLKDIQNACLYWNKAIESGYTYQPEWKEEYNIEDPLKLIEKHCGK